MFFHQMELRKYFPEDTRRLHNEKSDSKSSGSLVHQDISLLLHTSDGIYGI